ncbi:MAG: GTPase Obg [candidate division WS2 bacterium]|uniref:GTPase Obg n=1 Tax=Psychracetigena formicireducens TaxID=2986056 RepID=A0A9E2BGE2_PSYF1|nr:GTPase Obg [Candidatus Psychracetigena formicireducens]
MSEKLYDLSTFSNKVSFLAEDGLPGQKRQKAGRSGKNLIIEVPPGTRVIDALQDYLIIDLVSPQQEYLLARGGKGGRGNIHYKSSISRAPRYAEWGEIGDEKSIVLDLSLLLDVALLGAPNSGKSLLLNKITNAQADVDVYPYTTKVPVLGVLKGDPPLVLGEIPAFRNTLENLKYAKHFQRARVFVLVVDVSSAESALWLLDIINRYSLKNILVVFNKVDLATSEVLIEEFLSKLIDLTGQQPKYVKTSAESGEGLVELKQVLYSLYAVPINYDSEVSKDKIAQDEFPLPLVIKLESGDYEIKCHEIEKALSSINIDTPQGIQRLQNKIRDTGLEKLLFKEGIKPFDRVKIGDTWFTYLADEQ